MKCEHTLQAALALTSLGHVYSSIGDLNNSLASHKHCLKLVRQIGDQLAEAREIGNVGAVYLASGDFEKALECHLEHVKLAKLLGNKAEEARAYSNLGKPWLYFGSTLALLWHRSDDGVPLFASASNCTLESGTALYGTVSAILYYTILWHTLFCPPDMSCP